MSIGLNPVLLMLGPVVVRWGNLLALVGLGLGVWLTLREARQLGLSRRPILDALAWAIPVGVLTARVVHLLGWWDYYLTRPTEMWQLNPAGLSLWGALVGGGAVAAARLRHMSHRRARVLDAAAPGLALGIAVGRLGQFLDGAGQGLPSDLPWATTYSNPFSAAPDFGIPRHPAQAYDALIALSLLVTLLATRHWLSGGMRLWLFVVVYAAARVALGAVRLDPPFLFGLQIEQLVALGCLALGLMGCATQVRRPAQARPSVRHAADAV